MKTRAVDTFAEFGFDAELDIISVTRTYAVIRNIRLRRDGEEVLNTEELRARYVWPDVRDGQLQRLELDGTKLQLELGENWRPNADWITALIGDAGGDKSESPSRFPTDGINLTDATLVLTSPLGEATLYIDAALPTEDNFNADVTLAPSKLSYRGFAADGAGVAKLTRKDDIITIDGQAQTDVLSNPNVQIEDAAFELDGTANLAALSYTGLISINGDNITSRLFAADAVDLNWDGEISKTESIAAKGQWTVSTKAARTPRPKRADELADILALAPSLSVVPVTEHYSAALVQTVRDFLVGADVSGTGHLDYGPDGFTVSPTGAVTAKTKRNQISLAPRENETFYQFDKSSQTIQTRLDASFQAPVGLKLTDIKFKASSPNGLKLNGIDQFSTRLATADDWRTMDSENKPVRLGPMAARLQYKAQQTPRKLSIDTDLDFDGALPGGIVERLALQGRLDVHLYNTHQVLDFTPNCGSQITIGRLETPTNWVVENAKFTLPPTKSLFVRRPNEAKINADLQRAEFTLTHPETPNRSAQRLDLKAQSLDLSGQLLPKGRQNWETALTEAQYTSETLPSPGTSASAAVANLKAAITPNKPVAFTLNSPSISAQTPAVQLDNMQVSISGTPDAYDITHQNGTVVVIGSDFSKTAKAAGLDSFPADGQVKFSNGAYIGQSKLKVAKADNAEMIVDYTFANGAGTADINVPSIKFTSSGLQPQVLLPTLKGKIASVEGEAQAQLKIAFADGALTSSSGTVDLINLDLGTAPGPIAGLNTSVTFTSLLPLETDGAQTLTMKSFNPGLALEDGEVTYRLLPDGVGVDAARWPIGNGAFKLDPFTWVYAAEENRVTMRVEDVSLGDFLKNIGNRKIEATGTVVGTFPIVVRGVEVLVENGTLSVPDGGVLRIDPGPDVRSYTQEEAITIIRENQAAEYANLARDALREFEYRELNAKIDGPLDGEIEIGLGFDGANEKVLNGQPFRFNITVGGELFNIARSFNSNAQIKSEILRQNGQLPGGVTIGE